MNVQLYQASCVAIGDRAVLIEGPPGSGKSSLTLALVDRGAVLVGDDGVELQAVGDRIIASPAPTIAGLLEVRNLGLLRFPTAAAQPVALVLRLDPGAARFVEGPEAVSLLGIDLPLLRLWPDTPILALKAELALRTYGLR